MDKKLLAVLLLIPLASIGLTWLVLNASTTHQTDINFPTQENARKISDTFFNHTTIIDYSETGLPKTQIIGDQLFHYPGETDSEIINPRITLFRAEGSPVLITADHGWINKNGTQVLLKGHTIITREKSARNQFAQLESPELIIWPDKEYVETDKDVKITTDGTIATGVGMKAHIDTEHYFLLNRVKGRHIPARNRSSQ